MRRFVRHTLLFLIPVVLIFYAKPFYLLLGGKYKKEVSGGEIYVSIEKSKQKSAKKILLIGDSVGKQLLDNNKEHDSINSLACNQSIGVIGQYFLLKNYFEAGNLPKTVCLLFTPFSFRNNLDQVFTFHYFLKPFFNREYKAGFSNVALDQVQKIPFAKLSQEPYTLTSNWAPTYKPKKSTDYTFLSPISIEYLERIKGLCVQYNCHFYIIPTPTKLSRKKEIRAFKRKEIKGLNVEDELNYYLENIPYLSDSLYVDGEHLRQPELYTPEVLKQFQKVANYFCH